MEARFEIYEVDVGAFEWALVHNNGSKLAVSARTYSYKSNVRRAINSIMRILDADDVQIVDLTSSAPALVTS